MIHVVIDTKAPVDEFSDARTRPQIGRKAVGKGAAQQRLLESRSLRRGQLGRPTRGRKRTHSVASFGVEARTPASHGATIDTHPTSDLDGQQTFLQQIERAQAAALQLGRTSGRAHGFPPAQKYGTLLMQASIAFSDMSLMYGGVFDINQNWISPGHCGYRVGMEFDFKTTHLGPAVPVPPPAERKFLRVAWQLLQKHKFTVHPETVRPHWHVKYYGCGTFRGPGSTLTTHPVVSCP